MVRLLETKNIQGLRDNPKFTFKNVDEFRAWANSSIQRSFVAYLDNK